MVVNKTFPTDFTTKSNPIDADLLLIADTEDNNEMKKITIGSITSDIGDGLIIDGSESSTTTYSSVKINDLNDAQDTVISGLSSTKLNKNAQLRTGNGAWKTTYNNGSGDETELTLGAATRVFTSNGATSAPSWEVPTVDITSLTEDTTGDMAADFLLAYDNSATANRKQKPQVYTASDAEVIAGTATNKWVTPKQVKDRATSDSVTFTRDVSTASWTQTINHNLGRVPTWVTFMNTHKCNFDGSVTAFQISMGWYDGTTNNCSYQCAVDNSTSNTACVYASSIADSREYAGAITAWDSTTLTMTWTKTWIWQTGTFYIHAMIR